MGEFFIKLFISAFWIGLHAHVSGATTYAFNAGNTDTRCGSRTSKFWSNMNVPLSECITECGRRPKCLALNHRSRYSNFCELLDSINVVTTEPFECTYLTREDIDLSSMIPSGCSCNLDETCDITTNSCTKTECTAIRSVTNGQVFGNRYSIGHSLVTRCNQGYETLNGVTRATCMSTAEWNETPSCIKMCTSPDVITNGVISGTSEYYSQGVTLDVMCDQDYREENELPTITCLPSTSWDNVPNCILKECPPPSLPNGAITGSDYTIGSSLPVSCNDGYEEPSSIGSILCLSTQQWDSSPACVLKECPNPPPLPNGQIASANVYTVGTSLTVSCNTLYLEETSTSKINCLASAQWDYTPKCVLLECSDPPSLTYGQIVGAASYTVGIELSVICNTNYREEHSRTLITCSASANWDFIPKCKRIECSSPSIPNGCVPGNTFLAGNTYSIQCSNGYEEANNIGSIRCLSTGTWDYTPQCDLAFGNCETNWVQFETSCFYVSLAGDGPNKFDQARAACSDMGANLARIDSDGKYGVVRDKLNALSSTTNNYWIGLRRASQNDPIKWLDNGLEYSYNNFASGEPGTNSELCAFLWKNDGWYWHMGNCGWTDRFVCEKPSTV